MVVSRPVADDSKLPGSHSGQHLFLFSRESTPWRRTSRLRCTSNPLLSDGLPGAGEREGLGKAAPKTEFPRPSPESRGHLQGSCGCSTRNRGRRPADRHDARLRSFLPGDWPSSLAGPVEGRQMQQSPTRNRRAARSNVSAVMSSKNILAAFQRKRSNWSPSVLPPCRWC